MTIAEQLERRVGNVVRRVISELPQDLRELAERVPVFCEWEMADHCLESPRITFFLAELWDYCEEDPVTFDEEVRITYIHEFGHYLGLDESELSEETRKTASVRPIF